MGQSEREPFTELELSPLVEILARQFVQRWDIYPMQLGDGRWMTVHEPLHVGMMFAHLKGEITLGSYLLDKQSKGRYLVFDSDDEPIWNQLRSAALDLFQEGVPSYLEASRRGGHWWLFLPNQLPGKAVRQFGRGLHQNYGIEVKAVEIFPKQDQLKEGPGSLIRLPFGIHQKSGKRYGFNWPTNEPLASTLRNQLRAFSHVETVEKTVIERFQQKDREIRLKNRKRTISMGQGAIENQSDLAKMADEIKATVNIRDFVGQYVELSASGKGLCPFHDDHNPSFSINEANSYWHCFACNEGGNVINFWMRWQDCDFDSAIKELKKIQV